MTKYQFVQNGTAKYQFDQKGTTKYQFDQKMVQPNINF